MKLLMFSPRPIAKALKYGCKEFILKVAEALGGNVIKTTRYLRTKSLKASATIFMETGFFYLISPLNTNSPCGRQGLPQNIFRDKFDIKI